MSSNNASAARDALSLRPKLRSSAKAEAKPPPPAKPAMQSRAITVMLGGCSAEREVSLKTGAAAAQALRSLGHRVTELDPADESWTLPAKTEVVFLALHGTY